MWLEDFKTLREVAEETGIHIKTLQQRLDLPGFNLTEGKDFKRLGDRQPTFLSPVGIRKITQGIAGKRKNVNRNYLETKDNFVLSWEEEILGDVQKYKVKGEIEKVEVNHYYFHKKFEGYVDLSLDRGRIAFVFVEGLDNMRDILQNYWFQADKPIRKFFELVTKHKVGFLPWSFKEYMKKTYLVEDWDCLLKENYYRQWKETHSAKENRRMARLLFIKE